MTDETTTPDEATPEPATEPVADAEIVDPDEVQATDVQKYLDTMDRLPVEDPDEIAKEIVARRLQATNIADVLAPMEVISGKDIPRVPLHVFGVHFNRSTFEGLVNVYAVMDAVNKDTGQHVTVASGAADVLAQLYKLVEFDAFPMDLQFVPANRPSANGYFPIHLEAVPPSPV